MKGGGLELREDFPFCDTAAKKWFLSVLGGEEQGKI